MIETTAVHLTLRGRALPQGTQYTFTANQHTNPVALIQHFHTLDEVKRHVTVFIAQLQAQNAEILFDNYTDCRF